MILTHISHIKCFVLVLILTTSLLSQAQESGKVSKGSIGIGMYLACPQNQLQDIGYDEGLGIQLSYLSRTYPYKSKLNYQLGVQLDWGYMGKKTFNNIQLADDNIIGLATIDVTNRMYGGFVLGRINYGRDNEKFVPYLNLLIGHRNFNTRQLLSLDNPSENTDYQTDTFTNRVVFTKRIHYGGGVGVSTRLSEHLSLDLGATYTIGGTGSVLPLNDITRLNEGNEIDYTNHTRVRTDMLLINASIRFNLFKTYRYQPFISQTNQPSFAPSYTRYKDKTELDSRDIISNRNTPKTPSINKKTPIKIKQNGPTKDKNDES